MALVINCTKLYNNLRLFFFSMTRTCIRSCVRYLKWELGKPDHNGGYASMSLNADRVGVQWRLTVPNSSMRGSVWSRILSGRSPTWPLEDENIVEVCQNTLFVHAITKRHPVTLDKNHQPAQCPFMAAVCILLEPGYFCLLFRQMEEASVPHKKKNRQLAQIY